MWRMCDALRVFKELSREAIPLFVIDAADELGLDKGKFICLAVVKTFGDHLNSDVDRGTEPVRAIRKGEIRFGANGLVLWMGERIYGNEHIPREAFGAVDEAWSAGHDIQRVFRGLIKAKRRCGVLTISVNAGQKM